MRVVVLFAALALGLIVINAKSIPGNKFTRKHLFQQPHDDGRQIGTFTPKSGNKSTGRRTIRETAESVNENRTTTQAPWYPQPPRQFKYNVADGIRGANQDREEQWNNGTQTGFYVQPLDYGMWQKVHYVADEKGYRIIRMEHIPEDQIFQQRHSGTAEVKISTHDHDIEYKVQINKTTARGTTHF